ncbi:MAG TPA: bifunctional riboflavin kinase/FAD synthetase [Candidatus Omnitrophota bacterium]|nr:bifunctional riboflavin kinase/FAD synthetase [Candidatus Omnitrophota bacterium]HQL41190.1 bifunctional riboflavin kinase/FAD synthetase [Candidatus Omnitrophota bacterium]
MLKIFLDRQKKFKKFARPVVAIGVFDGVHRGHQKLILRAVARARQISGTSIVLTFFPHPVHVLYRKKDLSLLVSLEHRLGLIQQLGVDACMVVPFTKEFAKLRAEDFVRDYLFCKIGAKEIFIGQNFHFGRGRRGDSKALQSLTKIYSIQANVLRSVRCGRDVVSSSRLRHLVKDGNFSLAKKYLDREITFIGQVVRGNRRGRALGIPTANINCGPEILPPLGVYIVCAVVAGKKCEGIANVGYRPSFESSRKKNIEVHLFDFHRNIYGQRIEIQFLKKIRNEKKFLSPHHFLRQFQRDKDIAIDFFRKSTSI